MSATLHPNGQKVAPGNTFQNEFSESPEPATLPRFLSCM